MHPYGVRRLAGLGAALALSPWCGVSAQRADLLRVLGVPDAATMERMIMVPMRDGVRLSTVLITPASPSARLPTVLVRTPYDKGSELLRYPTLFARLVKSGYAIVVQNERGTEWSEGRHVFLAGARNDGYETLSWIAAQPWSNGRVGTFGCSSSAEAQLALAAMNHPAHRAMIPMSAGAGIGDIPGVAGHGLFHTGGVPELGPWAGWYAIAGHTNRPKLPPDLTQEERVRLADYYFADAKPERDRPGLPSVSGGISGSGDVGALGTLPSSMVLRNAGVPPSDFDLFMTMTPTDPRWRSIDFLSSPDQPRVPALHVNGWHDVGAYETVKLFEYLKDVPNQYLIMAPTSHCAMTRATARYSTGERYVGNAALPYDDIFVAWFDHWLKDAPNGVTARPKVQLFEEGADRWVTAASWPLADITPTRYYLRSDGRAQSRHGSGALTVALPGKEPADSFVADPRHPVPSRGGGCCDRDAVRDQRVVEDRRDVLVYSTEPLRHGARVMGEVKATLFLSSSARDTDLAIKLVDVYPDGRAFNLYDAIQRVRYRGGYASPQLMTPGEIVRVDVTGLVAGNYFAPGHRIRVEIASTNFPDFERNLQTGGANFDETVPVVAVNRIRHDADHASFVELSLRRPERSEGAGFRAQARGSRSDTQVHRFARVDKPR